MIKYIAAIFILWSVIYNVSFAKYCLSKKNKMAAAGAVFLIILVIAIPLMVMLTGK